MEMDMAVETQAAREATTTKKTGADLADAASPTLAELARIVETTAASDEWIGRVRLRSDRRWYERIYHGPEYDVWVISWLPGQATGFYEPWRIFGRIYCGGK
jgi:hypothetical protein